MAMLLQEAEVTALRCSEERPDKHPPERPHLNSGSASLDFIERLPLLSNVYLPIFIDFGADAGAAAEPGIGAIPSTILR
jgi:hypothetical protein